MRKVFALRWMRYRWFWLMVLAGVGFVLGFVGLDRYATAHGIQRSFLDTVYDDITLVRLGGSPEPPVPWELQVARFLVPGVVVYGAFIGVLALFSERVQQARLPFLRRHVVVVGLGDKGLAFVRAMRTERATVVGIDLGTGSVNLAAARQVGAIVIVGDARDRDVLASAGTARARHLIVAADDATNAEVVLQAQALTQGRRGTSLECLAHIVDHELCMMLRLHALRSAHGSGLRVDFFNLNDHAARTVCGATFRHGRRIVVIGTGPLAEQILVQIESISRDNDQKAPEVTVAGIDASAWIEAFEQRHPLAGIIARLDPSDIPLDAALLPVAKLLPEKREPAILYVCGLEDSVQVQIALTLRDRARATSSRIIVCTKNADGLASMLTADSHGLPLDPISVFAMVPQTCTHDLVAQGIYEMLGRAIHGEYVRLRLTDGRTAPGDVALSPWERLPETLKESNRAQAEYIGVKLRALGCDVVRADGSSPPFRAFTSDEVETLAKLEHQRWVSERRAGGWRLGPDRDPKTRRSPHLVEWEDLTEDVREMDRETVRQLPRLVASAGFRLVRLPPPSAVRP